MHCRIEHKVQIDHYLLRLLHHYILRGSLVRGISVRLGKFGPMAQIGTADDEDKKFASLMADQNIGNITLEEALNLFLLPKNLGQYKGEEVEVSNGRYGPYVRHGAAFISLPKGEDPLDVSMERAQELIDEKALADAPIAIYKGEGVQKGTGDRKSVV